MALPQDPEGTQLGVFRCPGEGTQIPSATQAGPHRTRHAGEARLLPVPWVPSPSPEPAGPPWELRCPPAAGCFHLKAGPSPPEPMGLGDRLVSWVSEQCFQGLSPWPCACSPGFPALVYGGPTSLGSGVAAAGPGPAGGHLLAVTGFRGYGILREGGAVPKAAQWQIELTLSSAPFQVP